MGSWSDGHTRSRDSRVSRVPQPASHLHSATSCSHRAAPMASLRLLSKDRLVAVDREIVIACKQVTQAIVFHRYSVNVDSSLLGPNSDEYEHRYLEMRREQPEPDSLRIDIGKLLD